MLIQNQGTFKDNKRHTMRVHNQDYAKLREMMEGVNDKGETVVVNKIEDVLHYLLENLDAKCDKGGNKVEKKIKEWLILGHSQRITANALKKAGGGTFDYNTIKSVMNVFKEEIEAHNASFDQ